jgi:hypothetical protein
MHTQIWSKYLPVVRILLKKAAANEQVLNLEVADFERAGLARKSGNKFSLEFSNGRADNATNASPLAKDFAAALLQDAVIKELFTNNSYKLSLNTKYQLTITQTNVKAEENVPETVENESSAS